MIIWPLSTSRVRIASADLCSSIPNVLTKELVVTESLNEFGLQFFDPYVCHRRLKVF